MKLVHLFLIVLAMPVLSAESDSIVVTASAKEIKELSDRATAVNRLDKLMDEAKQVIEKFESVKGQGAARKFDFKWREKTEKDGLNDAADAILLCKIKSIKTDKNDGKPVKIDEVYEASKVLLKYEANDIKLPQCFVLAMLDDKVYLGMLEILSDAKKVLQPSSTIADAKEKGAAEAAP